jgi:hypothetical protein
MQSAATGVFGQTVADGITHEHKADIAEQENTAAAKAEDKKTALEEEKRCGNCKRLEFTNERCLYVDTYTPL